MAFRSPLRTIAQKLDAHQPRCSVGCSSKQPLISKAMNDDMPNQPPMTPRDLDDLRRKWEAATKGPWVVATDEHGRTSRFVDILAGQDSADPIVVAELASTFEVDIAN